MVLYVYLEMEWCDELLEIDKLSDSEIACADEAGSSGMVDGNEEYLLMPKLSEK